MQLSHYLASADAESLENSAEENVTKAKDIAATTYVVKEGAEMVGQTAGITNADLNERMEKRKLMIGELRKKMDS